MESFTNTIDTITTSSSGPKKSFFIIIPAIFIIISTAIFLLNYFSVLSFDQFCSTKITPTTDTIDSDKTTPLPVGIQKAQALILNYPTMIKSTYIQQEFEGVLKNKTENSWTIAQGKELVTLSQTNQRQISFGKNKPGDFKIGSVIKVIQGINILSGEATIYSITLKN